MLHINDACEAGMYFAYILGILSPCCVQMNDAEGDCASTGAV